VVVLGDILLDAYIMGEVSRLSPEAPVPIVKVNKRSTSLGGAGNVALNLRALGCSVSLIAVRGADASGDRISAILKERGIGDHVLVDPAHITTTKTRVIAHKQQLVRLDEEDTWAVTDAYMEQLLQHFRSELAGANAVILSDYHKGVLNGSITQMAIQECRRAGIPVFVDPKRKNWERYKGATCITPNTSELEEIYGHVTQNEGELQQAVRSLKKDFEIEWFLATRGAEGMCLIGPDDQALFVSATASEVFDVSGAGDTVIATIAAAVGAGVPFKEAANMSNLAAGVVVRKIGAQPITIGELETELRHAQHGVKWSASAKITSLEAAQLQVKAWQSTGQRVALSFGTFELLHPGHTYFLSQARKFGNRLVVGLISNSESSFNLQVLSPQDRANVLSAVADVDLIIVCEAGYDAAAIASAIGPDALVVDPECHRECEPLRKLEQTYSGKVETVRPLQGFTAGEMRGRVSAPASKNL
jgi:D-beta-D-heptose 7-phosphate kinase / D-beta-D-heptose 1-phosphate adenosyltransferase